MAGVITEKNGYKIEATIKMAAVLFRKKGYRASSMRLIDSQAGVEAPGLYNHIKNKALEDTIVNQLQYGIIE
ncbi:MAG: helix-turn-helix transcriptional regulator [Bacteroidetes bacterium]|jgi:AcrR family transcriptional regulator|nr:helix-turn-helix transcriptional regulator [Bacteroidota bacterium]MBS1926891.1 helix-turn-helix transcriptional regulator [Bacteroidota bacterium]MCC6693685.1 helix-turn-helix transcriptional regulator [Chitinophagaceae bacterium]HMU23617.1 helix-turn-helix domain-containing protein [Ferruginibacter sp.]